MATTHKQLAAGSGSSQENRSNGLSLLTGMVLRGAVRQRQRLIDLLLKILGLFPKTGERNLRRNTRVEGMGRRDAGYA